MPWTLCLQPDRICEKFRCWSMCWLLKDLQEKDSPVVKLAGVKTRAENRAGGCYMEPLWLEVGNAEET